MNGQQFFEGLASEYQPLLARTEGSLRVDVASGYETDSWHLTIERGNVIVSRDPSVADSVVHINKELFEDVVAGRKNAMSATLRGEIGVEGAPHLLNLLQRLFPGPQEASAS